MAGLAWSGPFAGPTPSSLSLPTLGALSSGSSSSVSRSDPSYDPSSEQLPSVMSLSFSLPAVGWGCGG